MAFALVAGGTAAMVFTACSSAEGGRLAIDRDAVEAHCADGMCTFAGTVAEACAAERYTADVRVQSDASVPLPNMDGLDANLLSVHLVYTGGGAAELPRVGSAAACGAELAWYLDDPSAPSRVMICNAAGNGALASVLYVDVLAGCPAKEFGAPPGGGFPGTGGGPGTGGPGTGGSPGTGGPGTGGSTGFPPGTGGGTGFPPGTGGNTGFPPGTGGGGNGEQNGGGFPPGTGGTGNGGSGFPPGTGGSTGFPPGTGGNTGFPPGTGGSTGFPPGTGGSTGFPPGTGGSTGFPPGTGGWGGGDQNGEQRG
jgi:hypothetical protein